jgi:small subunit ribosomal protein S4
MRGRKKWKVQRPLGLELPGLGKPEALEKRNFPPGQHGRSSKRKPTQLGTQFREKQKLIFHYALREEHLRRFVGRVSLNTSNWMENLIGLLERRFDNVVFRLGFARSIAAVRHVPFEFNTKQVAEYYAKRGV